MGRKRKKKHKIHFTPIVGTTTHFIDKPVVRRYRHPKLDPLKQEAHYLGRQIFGSWDGPIAYDDMYRWMAENTRTGHIGTMTESELKALIRTFRRFLK